MNAAQHASQILEAWRRKDRCNLESVLDRAFLSCTASRHVSRLENEREELLWSIVEHLKEANLEGTLPEYSVGSGARALLSHLSANSRSKEQSEVNRAFFSTKILNFGTERATCFTEVECRPRAYAG